MVRLRRSGPTISILSPQVNRCQASSSIPPGPKPDEKRAIVLWVERLFWVETPVTGVFRPMRQNAKGYVLDAVLINAK